MHGRQSIVAVLLALILLTPAAMANDAPAGHSRQGADSCLKCHDETGDFPVMAIFRTPHGRRSDARAPMAKLQCEACHGPGGEHAGRVRPGSERPPIPNFGQHATASVAEQNQACLNCHQGGGQWHWAGSEHATAELSCTDCHSIHAEQDPALAAGGAQTRICTDCHATQDAELWLASAHPLRSGEMKCSDCHAPHGSANPAMLQGVTANEVCSDCHAEKRGPFLWEHAPVSEDCGLCHRPHGSNHPALLDQRPPWLCQQCHDQSGHPSVAHTPDALPSAMLSLRGCGNCHSQVHGSNHPSGATLMR